jgi:hypothetical protein
MAVLGIEKPIVKLRIHERLEGCRFDVWLQSHLP